jgi:hypothetical protein
MRALIWTIVLAGWTLLSTSLCARLSGSASPMPVT